jgi:hypothetical protein
MNGSHGLWRLGWLHRLRLPVLEGPMRLHLARASATNVAAPTVRQRFESLPTDAVSASRCRVSGLTADVFL